MDYIFFLIILLIVSSSACGGFLLNKNKMSSHWMWFGLFPMGTFIVCIIALLGNSSARVYGTQKKLFTWVICIIVNIVLIAQVFFIQKSITTGIAIHRHAPLVDSALVQINSDPRIKELIGTPIELGVIHTGWYTARMRVENAGIVLISLKGPKGKVNIRIVGEFNNGEWNIKSYSLC